MTLARNHPEETEQRYEKFLKEFEALKERMTVVSNLIDKAVSQKTSDSDQFVQTIKPIILVVLGVSASITLG